MSIIPRWTVFLLTMCAVLVSAQTQAPSSDSPTQEQVLGELAQLLRENSYSLTVNNDKLSGTGAEPLLSAGHVEISGCSRQLFGARLISQPLVLEHSLKGWH